jgi:WD40-like Beta Propeller Repeat
MTLGRGVIRCVALTIFATGNGVFGASLSYESTDKIDTPRLFGEGIISTQDDEFGGQFSQDGQTIWFSKSVPRFHLDTIFLSTYRKKHWTTPQVAPFSGIWHDYDPTSSPDGKRLFFISDRPRSDGASRKNYDIWYIEEKTNGWSDPLNAGSPINGEWNSHFAVPTSNGTLYFTSDRPGSKGWLDVWRARLVDGHYEEPENLGDAINDKAWATFEVYVMPDESFMIVSTYGHDDSLGDCDLYISYQRNGVWQPLRNLGPNVNSAARDYTARATPDGKYLFFTSERGLPTGHRSTPWTYSEFTKALHGTHNGLGNIYQMDLSAALEVTRADK